MLHTVYFYTKIQCVFKIYTYMIVATTTPSSVRMLVLCPQTAFLNCDARLTSQLPHLPQNLAIDCGLSRQETIVALCNGCLGLWNDGDEIKPLI